MSVLVQKYGGTSVADPEKLRNVARRVVEAVDARRGRNSGQEIRAERPIERAHMGILSGAGSAPRAISGTIRSPCP